MSKQFLVSIAGAVAAWFVIEKIKAARASVAVDPVAGLASSETQSQTWV